LREGGRKRVRDREIRGEKEIKREDNHSESTFPLIFIEGTTKGEDKLKCWDCTFNR